MIDWNKPIETHDGEPAVLVYVKPNENAPLRRVIAVHPGTSREYIITDSECTTHFRNVPEPGEQWTAISTPPSNSRTVLLTGCSENKLTDESVGPTGSLDYVWTGFFSSGHIFAENRSKNRDNGPAKFWRNLPS